MFFPRYVLAAAIVVALHPFAHGAEPAAGQFAELARLAPPDLEERLGREIEFDVDLAASPGFSVEIIGGRASARYRMAFNQIAEGWSWRPLADPAVDDYYRYKFLPLQSVLVDRGEYAHEDKIGVIQQMKVIWRYDYFFAFDNLYDFYPRSVDDDGGFSADLPAEAAGHLGLRVRARLIQPVLSESTTFWKATYGSPADFTLKKRYLIGILDEVDFIDITSGRTLCRIRSGKDRCVAG